MVFQDLFNFLNATQIHSYIILFFIMIVEGPIITAIAAYASSLGYFNIGVIFLISIFGNFIPDIIFYYIGRSSRIKSVELIVNKYFLSEDSVKKMEKNLHLHFGKTFFVTKLCPMLPIPGLLLSGFIKIPFVKFFTYDLIFNIIYSFVFILIGYSFGFAINSILKYFKLGQFSFFGILILIVIIYLVLKKIKNNPKEKYVSKKFKIKRK